MFSGNRLGMALWATRRRTQDKLERERPGDFHLEELVKLGRGCLGAPVWTAAPMNTTGKRAQNGWMAFYNIAKQ